MTEKWLFTIVFLLIFFITAIATIMGAAKIKPFHNMPDKWVKILIVPLLAELAVAVIGVFVSLYEPAVEKYTFVADYRHFLSDWKNNLGEKDSNCLKMYISSGHMVANLDESCLNIVKAYERKRAANNQKGLGNIFLEKGNNSYEGMAFYTFPGAQSSTIFKVTGSSANHLVQLTFSQEQDYFIETSGQVTLRPPSSFEVDFEEVDVSNGVFEGKLVGSDHIHYGVLRYY